MISFKVEGLDALEAQLKELGAELGQKTLAAAARKAFKPVLDTAKSRVASESGELRDALKLSVKKPKSGDELVVVGVRIGKGTGQEGAPPRRRWHFLEFGTSRAAARPFLRPALDQNATAVTDLLKTELSKAIDRAVRKRAKAGK